MLGLARRGALFVVAVAPLLVATGCAGELGGVAVLVCALGLALAGCAPAPASVDAPEDAAVGRCTPCCGFRAEFGYCGLGTSSCWCPAGVSCNYFVGCIDTSYDAPIGRLEPCCLADDGGTIGTVSSCFCPTGAACGFSFVDCGDGTCAFGDGGACPVDGGTDDTGLVDAAEGDAP